MAKRLASVEPSEASAALAACVCQSFRTVSRAVTQMYDQTLAPSGLRSTQLVVLLAVAANEPVSPSHLARQLVMDRTTLARNTKPLIQAGYITQQRSHTDKRRRLLSLSDKGHHAITTAAPLWQQAQNQFINTLGCERWKVLQQQLAEAMKAARSAS